MIDIDKLVVSLFKKPVMCKFDTDIHFVTYEHIATALKDQGLEYRNGELHYHSESDTEEIRGNIGGISPKFKVGDTIRNIKYGNKYIKHIVGILDDSYVLQEDEILTFNCQDKWELVQPESTFEKKKQTGDKIIFSDSLECQVNMSQLNRIAKKENSQRMVSAKAKEGVLEDKLTEFEQCLKSGTNIYVEQGRRMEDWDAREDAKELIAIARQQVMIEALQKQVVNDYISQVKDVKLFVSSRSPFILSVLTNIENNLIKLRELIIE